MVRDLWNSSRHGVWRQLLTVSSDSEASSIPGRSRQGGGSGPKAVSDALARVEAFDPGSGLLELSGSFDGDIGRLAGSVESRVTDAVSLFAGADVDTNKDWKAIGGLRVRW